MTLSPFELAGALGLPPPTDEQAAVIAAPPGPLVVVAGAGAGKTETMAARVVWLVANGYAHPGQVLGLTFTRKAAGQLLRRVRSRLARLSGHLGETLDTSTATPLVSTYHAFAGSLLREFGLLLPVEPDARLLSETERWQLAFEVINAHPDRLPLDKTPAAVTAMVLRLSGELAEHLVDTAALTDTHRELDRLVHHLPAGPRQRGDGPNRRLLDMLDTQTDRAALVPLIDALHTRLRQSKAMDFGSQMAAAARLATACPQVGEQLRARYRVVLLDEYQDTGHAQRIALSALFGGGADGHPDGGLALTAVGDPIQSIYGWRGASATNLPRFTTDFPCSSHGNVTPAPTLELSTSWRNPPRALTLANAVSAEARRRSVGVRPLRSRPDAPPGTVLCTLQRDVETEREWLADRIAARYGDGVTAAVLVRRNSDAGPIARALSERGVPVEVVGLAGLLSIAEVAQLVSMLRLVADPSAGTAAMEVLTGPRWRLGARDLAALWRRAVLLDGSAPAVVSAEQIVAAAAADADTAALADALADPGPAENYSAEGYRRIGDLGVELARLRGFLAHPLTDLVSEVRRVMGVDAEVRAAGAGGEHLDRFADVVAGYTESAGADIAGLLAYLDVAAVAEKGLAPAEVGVAAGRVQVLTVHAAKGLEWQIVAVPHLSARLFPSTAKKRTWLNDPADLPPLLRGDRASVGLPGDQGGAGLHGVPVLDTSTANDRKALEDIIGAHRDQLMQRSIDEERRLLYVALTRTEDTLLISGHHWGADDTKPRGPSEFLCEIRDIIEATAQSGDPCGEIEHWEPDPADGDPNPLQDNVSEVLWPVDPLGGRRGDIQRGAQLVSEAMAATSARTGAAGTGEAADPHGWVADVDALLAERARAGAKAPVPLPAQLSVSALVELDRDPGAAARLTRRLPARPDPHALLGTAFHDWVQRFYGAERLFDLDDLPGAGDPQTADADELAALQDAFSASPWAARTPLDVEVPFELALTHPGGEQVIRGRIDAVFADTDGGVTVVDWKTGEPPRDAKARRHAAVQLAVYRLAWAGLTGRPASEVRAVFHYVRSGRTVKPEALYDAEDLAVLLSPDRSPRPDAERYAGSPAPG
jgi:DNA helicase-2/ATP-dependent DNA helicase PcrA